MLQQLMALQKHALCIGEVNCHGLRKSCKHGEAGTVALISQEGMSKLEDRVVQCMFVG
jgi:hypothetical protein